MADFDQAGPHPVVIVSRERPIGQNLIGMRITGGPRDMKVKCVLD